MSGKSRFGIGLSVLAVGAMLAAFQTPSDSAAPARTRAASLPPCPKRWCTVELRTGIRWMYRTAGLPAGVPRVNVVDIDPNRALVNAVESVYATAGYEPVAHMAARTKALVAINGGFFYYHTAPPFGFQSMLKLERKLIASNPVPRPALGLRHTLHDAFAFAVEPVAPGSPDPLEPFRDAVGAGPFVIVPSPRPSIGVPLSWTADPGGFDWSCSEHPRSAVWLRANGHLMLGAFDGVDEAHGFRLDTPTSAYCSANPSPRPSPNPYNGIALGEFIKQNFPDTIQAMNLDGGGSTTFVVRGTLVNEPTNTPPRSVIDGILVFSRLLPR